MGQFLTGTNIHGFLATGRAVPLPSTLLLLGWGLLGLGAWRGKLRKG